MVGTYRAGGRTKLSEEGRCRMCLAPKGTRGKLTRHHLAPRRLLRGAHWRIRDADENIVPLCEHCHREVEADVGARAMLRKVLGSAEVAFARSLAGVAWFERHYPAAPGKRPDGAPAQSRLNVTPQPSVGQGQPDYRAQARRVWRDGTRTRLPA